MLDYLIHNRLSYIDETQHGFVKHRSTTTNLVWYSSFFAHTLQERKQVDAIYTDLSAAFDKLDHRVAIAKLERLGFGGQLLNWLASYLTERSMRVKIGDQTSHPLRIVSGVPQGSHLGPFIFLLYVNDVNFLLKCSKLSYADDFKLFQIITKHSDALNLQQQVDTFADWCKLNGMVLNASKCSVISFTRKRSQITFDYMIDNVILKRDDCVKDLGVLFDSKLTFKNHISYVVSKASKCLGFLFRVTKHFKNVHCLKALFCALVRSTLEYASPVWSPYYQNSTARIESVQKKFVRFALRNLPWHDPIYLTPYNSLRQLIGLETLVVRRNVSKALFVADLIQNRIDCPAILQALDFNTSRRTFRSFSVFRLPRARTNYGFNEPITSMCRVFNQCYSVFDYNLSRAVLKTCFTRFLDNT